MYNEGGRRAILRLWLLGAAICCAATGPVAACDQWSVAGPFTIAQSNSLTVTGEFRQEGSTLSGTAAFFSPTLGDGGTELDGNISGSISGNAIFFDVHWYGSYVTCDGECVGGHYDSVGAYEGSIDGAGVVSGLNWRHGAPAEKVSWRMSGQAACPPPPPKKIVGLGKKKASPPPKPGVADAVEPGFGFAARRCRSGYVWREAQAGDYVCVPPEARDRVAQENAAAAGRRDPNGAYGPNTCISGFVWREAYEGDAVCVTPESRATAREENALAESRAQ